MPALHIVGLLVVIVASAAGWAAIPLFVPINKSGLCCFSVFRHGAFLIGSGESSLDFTAVPRRNANGSAGYRRATLHANVIAMPIQNCIIIRAPIAKNMEISARVAGTAPHATAVAAGSPGSGQRMVHLGKG